MIYKYGKDFFWFEDTYIVSSHNGSPKLEYYSLIEFTKISDYEFIKEKQGLDFSNYYEIITQKELDEILIQKRRDYKISLIIEDI
jgi:hypothetical protein